MMDFSLEEDIFFDTTNSSVFFLNNLQQGSDYMRRIGNGAFWDHAKITFHFKPSGNNSVDTEWCKLALVFDRQPSGAIPQYTDIYKDSNDTSDVFTEANYSNIRRFAIVKEWRHMLAPQPNSTTGRVGAPLGVMDIGSRRDTIFSETVDLRGLSSKYDDGKGVIGISNTKTGAFYWVIMGSAVPPGNPPGWLCKLYIRLYFKDAQC